MGFGPTHIGASADVKDSAAACSAAAATSRMLSPPLELPADEAAELPAALSPAAALLLPLLLLHAATATSGPVPHSVIAYRDEQAENGTHVPARSASVSQ
jgi:hypothetical protein